MEYLHGEFAIGNSGVKGLVGPEIPPGETQEEGRVLCPLIWKAPGNGKIRLLDR